MAPHTVSWDMFARPPRDTQRLAGLEASRHVSAVFRSYQVAENWLGRCWWLRDLSLDRVAERILTLGSLVGKIGHLDAILGVVGASRTPHRHRRRLNQWSGHFGVHNPVPWHRNWLRTAPLSHEDRKRVTKFVKLAFADTGNPTVFPALRVRRCGGFENLARRVVFVDVSVSFCAVGASW